MAIADKLLELNDVKQNIKTAIEGKGVNMTGVPFTNYPLKISEISGGGGGGEEYEYFYYSKAYYTITNNSALFENAWEHSLTVDPTEIERSSSSSTQYGKLQYPNGANNGVIIPNSVTSIGASAFYNWTSNKQPLVIPNSVTNIGNDAFYGWKTNNQPLVIPNSVTRIGESAFRYWNSNNHPLVIPNSVTSIGWNAFNGWPLVPYIIMEREVPPTISTTSFNNQNDAPIYVPHDSVNDYKTATNWTGEASRIKSINDKP